MMAQALDQMREVGYDALLYHHINYRDWPEYKDTRLLDEADKLVLLEGRNKYLLWIEHLTNAIEAAVRRRRMKLVVDTSNTTKH